MRKQTFCIDIDENDTIIYCKGYAIYEVKNNKGEFVGNYENKKQAQKIANQNKGIITKIITDEFCNEVTRFVL